MSFFVVAPIRSERRLDHRLRINPTDVSVITAIHHVQPILALFSKNQNRSPGQLHLGSLTLPLPIGFGRTRGVDAAQDEQDDRLGELSDQAARGRVWENWQRRAAVIRERVDRERAERAAAGDTTRSR